MGPLDYTLENLIQKLIYLLTYIKTNVKIETDERGGGDSVVILDFHIEIEFMDGFEKRLPHMILFFEEFKGDTIYYLITLFNDFFWMIGGLSYKIKHYYSDEYDYVFNHTSYKCYDSTINNSELITTYNCFYKPEEYKQFIVKHKYRYKDTKRYEVIYTKNKQ